MIAKAVKRTLPAFRALAQPSPGLPRWWAPAAMRVIDFRCGDVPPWARHRGTVSLTIGESSVRIVVSEPYPWFEPCCDGEQSAAGKWAHVIGDYADQVPADEIYDAQYLAIATGCDLVIERVAWWNPYCIRLTFRPARLPDGRMSHEVKIAEWRRMVPEVENLLKRYYDEPKYV